MPCPSSIPTHPRPALRWWWLVLGALASTTGCQSGLANAGGEAILLPTVSIPSNDRNWIAEHRVLASAQMTGEEITLQNVRDAEFFTYRDCVVDYYDKTFK